MILAYVKNRCSAEDKYYEYNLDEPRNTQLFGGEPRNTQLHPSMDERDCLVVQRSDSGGFKSHKPETIVALNNSQHNLMENDTPYNIKRQSMIKSQECIADMPDLPSELPDPSDVVNGNAHFSGYHTLPLETTM